MDRPARLTRIGCRCDGSPQIGMGHVVRSSALAAALRDRGASVEFLMRREAAAGIAAAESLGFAVREVAPRDESELLPEIAGEYDALVVDHYEAGAATLARCSARTLVGVIDDEAKRDLTPVRWLLNQNPGADGLPYSLSESTICLFGPRYALLRPAFRDARARLDRRFEKGAQRLLLTFGGGAVSAYVRRALSALDEIRRRLEIVVLGCDPLSVDSRHDVRFVKTAAVDEYMAWCDVAVSAAGSTAWELCCLGVPFIAMPIAQNQSVVVRGLQRARAAVSVDSFDAGCVDLPSLVTCLLDDPAERRALSERGSELVDGLGAARAADSLLDLTSVKAR